MAHLLRFAAVVVIGLLLDCELKAESIFEDFSVDPFWTLVGTGSNGNDFGYRPTALAGGVAGEGGGHITRSNFVRSYADTALGGALGLSNTFQASGKLDVTGYNFPDMPILTVGHFDPLTNAAVGLILNNTPEGTLYVDAGFVFADGSEQRMRITSDLTTNVDRTWNYIYDPIGGVNGVGRLTASVSGPDAGSVFVDLTSTDRLQSVGLTAFGIHSSATSPDSGNLNRPDWFTDIFIDDVTYSNAVVPEPASWLISVTGALGLLLGRRSRAKQRRISPTAACPSKTLTV